MRRDAVRRGYVNKGRPTSPKDAWQCKVVFEEKQVLGVWYYGDGGAPRHGLGHPFQGFLSTTRGLIKRGEIITMSFNVLNCALKVRENSKKTRSKVTRK